MTLRDWQSAFLDIPRLKPSQNLKETPAFIPTMHIIIPLLSLAAASSSVFGFGFNPPANPNVAPRLSLSNADRLTRGLPLIKPKLWFAKKSVNSSPSGYPVFPPVIETTNTGAIGCYTQAGTYLGFYQPGGGFKAPPSPTPARRRATTYTYPEWSFKAPTADGIFSIYIPGSEGYTLQGLSACDNLDLKPGNAQQAHITISGLSSSKRYVPVCDASRSLQAQPWIWSIEEDSGELKAHWVNTDGQTAPNTMFYNSKTNFIGITGDLGAVLASPPPGQSAEDIERITFYYGALADWDEYLFPAV